MRDVYNGDCAALADRLRTESGAVVVVPHTERRSLYTLRALRPDAMEIFNLHAVFDPDIRAAHLGLDPAGGIVALLPFLLTPATAPHPDLAGLALFRVNDDYLRKWTALTREGQHVTGVTGSDAHQNVLPMAGIDGERVESYRRMMRFVSNHLLASQPGIEGVKEAIRAGRNFVVAEALVPRGDPRGAAPPPPLARRRSRPVPRGGAVDRHQLSASRGSRNRLRRPRPGHGG